MFIKIQIVFLFFLSAFGINSLANAQVPLQNFVAVYKDPSNNVFWSKTIEGMYSNGCVDGNSVNAEPRSRFCTYETDKNGQMLVKADYSAAAKACIEIGGRLPTYQEYFSLFAQFGVTKANDRISPERKAEMQRLFGDSGPFFWSSTLLFVDEAVFFAEDGWSLEEYRWLHMNVRCVTGP